MYAQFFGTFLLSHNVVTKDQLLSALGKKSSQHMKLGTLAIMKGYMTANEVDNVIISQTHNDCRFGDLAVREGYLTQEQVDELESHINDIDYEVAKEREKLVRHDVMSHVYEYAAGNTDR